MHFSDWSVPDYIGIVTGIVSIIIWFLSARTWFLVKRREERDNQRITIKLQHEDDTRQITLPAHPRRRDLTRGEIQGLVGTLPVAASPPGGGSQPRYRIAFFLKDEFYPKLEELQEDESKSELIITCTAAEWNQFDIEQIKQFCTAKGL